MSIDYLSIEQIIKIILLVAFSQFTKLGWGTSTRKFSQNINEDIVKTIFGSSGLGISFMNDDIIVDMDCIFMAAVNKWDRS